MLGQIDLAKILTTGVWIEGLQEKFLQPVEYEGILTSYGPWILVSR